MIFMAIAAFLAFFVKGLCGFANTMIFTSVLSFGMNNVNIAPVELLIGSPGNMIVAWKERRYIDWKLVLPLTALVLLGDIPGVFLLKSANAQAIKVLLGGVIILLGLSMLRPQTAVRKRPSWPVIALVSVISGLLCGLYGIGALVAVLCAHITDNSHASKGTMNVILLGDNLFRVIVYAATGILTGPVIKQALLLMPVMVAGLLLGIRCIAKVNERTARFIIILALILSGAALIITNL